MSDHTPDLDAVLKMLDAAATTSPGTLQSAFDNWQDRFKKDLKEERGHDTYAVESCLLAGERTSRAILSWCEQHDETPSELASKLWYIKDFITQLYDALSQRDAALTTKGRFAFWRHVDIANITQPGKKAERENFLDRQSLKNLADLYLARPWMHNADLDWAFTDALIAAEFVGTYEWLQAQQGFAYALFQGDQVKTALFKLVQVPVTFFLGWVAPGLFCWWLNSSFPMTSIILGVAYYVVNLGWLAIQLGRRALFRIRGGKTPRQRAAELNTSMFDAYYELRETTIHVPSLRRAVEQAKEKGVAWDPQVFCLLDNVAQKSPNTWTGGPMEWKRGNYFP